MQQRLKVASLSLVLAFVAAGLPAQEKAQPAPQPPFEQLYRMPLVYSVPGMDKVEVRRDVVYKSVANSAAAGQGLGSTAQNAAKLELKLDAYIPAGAKERQRFPMVVLISGGGADPPYDWRDAGVYQGYGRALAASGFVAITFSKRYARGAEGTLNGLEDFGDMVRYVRANAGEFHVDPERMAFWAFSAGGFLLSPALSHVQPYARAAICFYCVTGTDFPSMTESDRARLTPVLSPLEQIERSPKAPPPIFVGRAGWDSEDLNRNLDRFIAAALAHDLNIEVLNHPHGRHSFDIIDDVPRTREIIQSAIEFLHRALAVE